MSIRKIGNRWQVRVRRGPDHPRIEQTLPPGATRNDARELEVSIRRASIDIAIGRKQRYLIDEAFDQWQATGAEKLKSWNGSLKYRVGMLREMYTVGEPIEALIEVAERVKADGQRGGINPVTTNRLLAILRRIGNLVEGWGWTDAPLGRRIKLLPENSNRHVYLTSAGVEALAKAAGEAGDMVRFAALSGLRLGEMLALQPAQMQGSLLILGTNTKTMQPRGVPLPPEAVRIARRSLPWALTRKQLRDRWDAARKAAGRPDVHWHDLRHTYASWLVQRGEALQVVGKLLGHSNQTVTQRYAHLAPQQLSKAVAKLPTLGKKRGKPKKKKAA